MSWAFAPAVLRPTEVVGVEEWPRTSSGKIDRKACKPKGEIGRQGDKTERAVVGWLWDARPLKTKEFKEPIYIKPWWNWKVDRPGHRRAKNPNLECPMIVAGRCSRPLKWCILFDSLVEMQTSTDRILSWSAIGVETIYIEISTRYRSIDSKPWGPPAATDNLTISSWHQGASRRAFLRIWSPDMEGFDSGRSM